MQLLPIVKMVSGSSRYPKTEVIAYAKVDDEYYEYLSQFRWISHKGGYPRRFAGEHANPKRPLLHREVAALAGWDVPGDLDHIDHDTLNAQLSNLRLATSPQNGANAKRREHSTTGFKGVHYHKANKKYTSHIGYKGKHFYLGIFPNARTAAMIYDYVAKKVFGEFAATNKALGLLDYTDDDMRELLNTRMRDLRPITRSQAQAKRKLQKDNTSGFKGVSQRSNKRYLAYITYKGKRVHLDTFNNPRMAARAYDYCAVRLFGEFASANKAMGLLDG